VKTVAAAFAAPIAEPMLVKSVAAVDISSGAAITNDMACTSVGSW